MRKEFLPVHKDVLPVHIGVLDVRTVELGISSRMGQLYSITKGGTKSGTPHTHTHTPHREASDMELRVPCQSPILLDRGCNQCPARSMVGLAAVSPSRVARGL